MKINGRICKVISILLCALVLVQFLPTAAFALNSTYSVTVTESGSSGGNPFVIATTAIHGDDYTQYVLKGQSDAWYCDVVKVVVGGTELIRDTDYTYTDYSTLFIKGDKVTGDIEIFAQVNAKVTFDLNGGDIPDAIKATLTDAGVAIVDEKFTIPMPYGVASSFGTTVETLNDRFIRTGYSCTGLKNGDVDADLTAGLRNCELTLQWSPNDYDAIFDANGGAWEDGETTKTLQDVEFGTAIAAPQEDPVREGYTFAGWTPTVGDMTEEGMTFTAQWEHTVTFMVDGASVDEQSVEHGGLVTLPSDPSKEMVDCTFYTFAGWSDMDGGEVLDAIPPVTENAVYYAVFTERVEHGTVEGFGYDYYGENAHTVKCKDCGMLDEDAGSAQACTFDSDTHKCIYCGELRSYWVTFMNAEQEFAAVSCTHGKELAIAGMPVPQKDGFTFAGWYTNDGVWLHHGITVTSDMTGYATWEKASTQEETDTEPTVPETTVPETDPTEPEPTVPVTEPSVPETTAPVTAPTEQEPTASDSVADTKPVDPSNPATGDTSNVMLWSTMFAVSLAIVATVLIYSKNRKKENV